MRDLQKNTRGRVLRTSIIGAASLLLCLTMVSCAQPQLVLRPVSQEQETVTEEDSAQDDALDNAMIRQAAPAGFTGNDGVSKQLAGVFTAIGSREDANASGNEAFAAQGMIEASSTETTSDAASEAAPAETEAPVTQEPEPQAAEPAPTEAVIPISAEEPVAQLQAPADDPVPADPAAQTPASELGVAGPADQGQIIEPDPAEPMTQESTENVSSQTPAQPAQSIAADYAASAWCSQLILVQSSGSNATVTMHEIQDGVWTEIMRCSGFVGINGVGPTWEGDPTTPEGTFSMSMAFGIKANPGTAMPYLQVNENHYWVDDSNSAYYNKLVDTSVTTPDWNSAEHLIEAEPYYYYAIVVDYNTDCVPGAGSAIFLHCTVYAPSQGCIQVPEENMVFILNHLQPGALIVIE